MRTNFAHKPTCLNTFKKYMHQLPRYVEFEIAKVLPNKCSLILDGWTSRGMHYVALFATFLSIRACGYDKVFLGFYPLEKEDRLDSNNDYQYMSSVLSVFRRTFENVV